MLKRKVEITLSFSYHPFEYSSNCYYQSLIDPNYST